jgi:hypothetical protein
MWAYSVLNRATSLKLFDAQLAERESVVRMRTPGVGELEDWHSHNWHWIRGLWLGCKVVCTPARAPMDKTAAEEALGKKYLG